MLLRQPVEGCSQPVELHCYGWSGEQGHGDIYRKHQWRDETERLIFKILTLGMHNQEYASLAFEVIFGSMHNSSQSRLCKQGVQRAAL